MALVVTSEELCCAARRIHVLILLPLDSTSGKRLKLCCTARRKRRFMLLPLDGTSGKRLKLCCTAQPEAGNRVVYAMRAGAPPRR